MTSKKQRTSSKRSSPRAEWAGFVNVYLTSAEKTDIKKNVLTDLGIVDFISNIAEAGYKFSITHTESGGFYSATLYGQWAGRPNAGYAMSLKHADLVVAITALSHCHLQADADGDWGDRFTTGSNNDW